MNKLVLVVLLSMASCAKLNLKANFKSDKGVKSDKGIKTVLTNLVFGNGLYNTKHVKNQVYKNK